MKRIYAPLAQFFALFFILFSYPAFAIPRLIGSYPADGDAAPFGTNSITFAFSEPINPLSITQPFSSSGQIPSYEGFEINVTPPYENPFPIGGEKAIPILEGQIIRMDKSSIPSFPDKRFMIILHKDGFKNFKDEPLDHDNATFFL